MMHIYPEGDEDKHTFNDEGECECNPCFIPPTPDQQGIWEHRKYTLLEEAEHIKQQASHD